MIKKIQVGSSFFDNLYVYFPEIYSIFFETDTALAKWNEITNLRQKILRGGSSTQAIKVL